MSNLHPIFKSIITAWMPKPKSAVCFDCSVAEGVVHYGMGAIRCQPCADLFGEKLRLKRKEYEAQRVECETCGEQYHPMKACKECCDHEHDPSEGMMCIICDKEWDGP